jgi:hypothetical protein
MNKARGLLVAGVGVMTPGLVITGVQARTVAPAAIDPPPSGAQTVAFDQETLKHRLLGLSPAEKLRIGGDRIHLAKFNLSTQSRPNVKASSLACATGGSCSTQGRATQGCTTATGYKGYKKND